MDVRRVVTGHDENNKAVFVSDEEVPPVTAALVPGAEFHRLWGADQTPTFPDQGLRPSEATYFPALGGFRFGFFTVPPNGTTLPPDVDMTAALAEYEEKLPGSTAYGVPGPPGMHMTDTIDFEVIISGEVALELDDGAERILRPGDTVVQNGTKHRWRNPGTEPAVMAVVMLGAQRRQPT